MTTFVADAAFIIGSRHTCVAMPCQDYARAAPNVVVVSDGCSSGAHTDLGARQWNLAALDAWSQVPLKNPEQYLEQLLKSTNMSLSPIRGLCGAKCTHLKKH